MTMQFHDEVTGELSDDRRHGPQVRHGRVQGTAIRVERLEAPVPPGTWQDRG